MNLCVIPARGGSKRIPRKNIKAFLGNPIIFYSIKAAIDSQCFDKVIVSTNDQEIAKAAQLFGAEVPFIRSDELSDDYTGVVPVVKHAIEWCNKNGQSPADVCCLYATAPFVQKRMIEQAYKQLKETQANYCFAATNFPFPVQRAIRLTEEGFMDVLYPEHSKTRSQDLEEAYHDAGQFFWGRSEAFIQQKPVLSKESTPYILPRYMVQDIDTQEDWIRAESMFRVLQESGVL